MKVYLFYLRMEDKYKRRPNTYKYDITDFVGSINSYVSKRYSDETDTWYFLYGITDDKDIAEEFKRTRNMDKFHFIEKKMCKKDYDYLSKENTCSVLKRRTLGTEDTPKEFRKSIICNKIEQTEMTEYEIYMEQIMGEVTVEPYSQFSDEYIKALDILYYTYFHQSNTEDSDFCCYQASYSCTPENYRPYTGYEYNPLYAFIKVFKYTLM